MHIITHACTQCGTVVSANELESNRVMKCPGLDCENVLRFTDLDQADQKHFLDNKASYEL
ncbi:hypothetical protein ACOZ4B_08845 [Haloferax prahovense]|uniref:hypothetical protein n=1 Tax=Haloferax prahovense TaxID=381852 RepID=UPI003C787509